MNYKNIPVVHVAAMSQQLANGWSSHVDAGSGNTYYSRGEVTTWEMPADAA